MSEAAPPLGKELPGDQGREWEKQTQRNTKGGRASEVSFPRDLEGGGAWLVQWVGHFPHGKVVPSAAEIKVSMPPYYVNESPNVTGERKRSVSLKVPKSS